MRELDVITVALADAAVHVMGGDRSAESKETEAGVYDVVTEPDLLAERTILDRLRSEFPGDTVISEETNPDVRMSGRTWAVDPIDGTMNYSRGIPLFGMQAVFTEDGVPCASAIHVPVHGEMFTASADGAFLNGAPIRTAGPRPLRECILSTGDFSRRSQAYREAQAVLMHDCYGDIARFKVLGAACLDFAYLASGRTDIHVRFVNRVWDFLPGMYLAEMAGAVYDRGLMDRYGLLVMCSCEEVLEEAVGTIVPRILPCLE